MLRIGIEDEKESLAKEFEDKEQLLGASIEAKEAAAWSLMREKHRRELQALTVNAQAMDQRKLQKDIKLERLAAKKLQRLSAETCGRK